MAAENTARQELSVFEKAQRVLMCIDISTKSPCLLGLRKKLLQMKLSECPHLQLLLTKNELKKLKDAIDKDIGEKTGEDIGLSSDMPIPCLRELYATLAKEYELHDELCNELYSMLVIVDYSEQCEQIALWGKYNELIATLVSGEHYKC